MHPRDLQKCTIYNHTRDGSQPWVVLCEIERENGRGDHARQGNTKGGECLGGGFLDVPVIVECVTLARDVEGFFEGPADCRRHRIAFVCGYGERMVVMVMMVVVLPVI
jgi:hypothetical protein